MKKKYIILIVTCVLFIVYVLTSIGINKYRERKSYEEAIKHTSYYKDCQIINDYNTNIMILGDMFEGNKYLTFNQIYNVDDVNLDSEYNVLIINDLSANVELEDDDYIKIKEMIDSNNNLLFICLGNSKFEKFRECGVITCNIPSGYNGVVARKLDNGCFLTQSDLEWMKKYNKTFEEELCLQMASFIKDLN